MSGSAVHSGVTAVNGDCLKLTSYFGERQRTEGRFTADALLDLYGRGSRRFSTRPAAS